MSTVIAATAPRPSLITLTHVIYGAFDYEVTFPKTGMYRVLSDFYPEASTPQLIANTVFVGAPDSDAKPTLLAKDYTPKQGRALADNLAKIAGIVLAHPGLRLEIDGHTDSVGSGDFNQRLSEKRAATVRDFVVQQGIAFNAVSAHGFGQTMPIASNDTASGRQRNRRVEMIVAGDVIGIPIGATAGSKGRQ